jgi:hypothetical protein
MRSEGARSHIGQSSIDQLRAQRIGAGGCGVFSSQSEGTPDLAGLGHLHHCVVRGCSLPQLVGGDVELRDRGGRRKTPEDIRHLSAAPRQPGEYPNRTGSHDQGGNDATPCTSFDERRGRDAGGSVAVLSGDLTEDPDCFPGASDNTADGCRQLQILNVAMPQETTTPVVTGSHRATAGPCACNFLDWNDIRHRLSSGTETPILRISKTASVSSSALGWNRTSDTRFRKPIRRFSHTWVSGQKRIHTNGFDLSSSRRVRSVSRRLADQMQTGYTKQVSTSDNGTLS